MRGGGGVSSVFSLALLLCGSEKPESDKKPRGVQYTEFPHGNCIFPQKHFNVHFLKLLCLIFFS